MIDNEANENIGYTADSGRSAAFGPVPEFSAEEISGIRSGMGMSRDDLAAFMGVTKKTVASWEQGRTSPRGPAMRLLEMIKK